MLLHQLNPLSTSFIQQFQLRATIRPQYIQNTKLQFNHIIKLQLNISKPLSNHIIRLQLNPITKPQLNPNSRLQLNTITKP